MNFQIGVNLSILLLFSTLFFLPSTTALASARDDVMSGSARCMAIQANRDWLNCYYGAAQPMRTELGLPPATTVQIGLVPRPTGVTAPAPSQGGTRDAVMSGSARCAAILDNRIWLDCYYGAAQPMRAELGLPPALTSQTALAATQAGIASKSGPSQPIRKSQGMLTAILGGEKLTQKMNLTSYKFDTHGVFTVTLSNGQVWRQVEDDSSTAHWNKPAARYMATIYSGAFGSFNMRFDGDSNVYKVRPVSQD
jgi:hypothetical protein